MRLVHANRRELMLLVAEKDLRAHAPRGFGWSSRVSQSWFGPSTNLSRARSGKPDDASPMLEKRASDRSLLWSRSSGMPRTGTVPPNRKRDRFSTLHLEIALDPLIINLNRAALFHCSATHLYHLAMAAPCCWHGFAS